MIRKMKPEEIMSKAIEYLDNLGIENEIIQVKNERVIKAYPNTSVPFVDKKIKNLINILRVKIELQPTDEYLIRFIPAISGKHLTDYY